MPQQPRYRPGAIINGHILGTDNQWHPYTQDNPHANPNLYRNPTTAPHIERQEQRQNLARTLFLIIAAAVIPILTLAIGLGFLFINNLAKHKSSENNDSSLTEAHKTLTAAEQNKSVATVTTRIDFTPTVDPETGTSTTVTLSTITFTDPATMHTETVTETPTLKIYKTVFPYHTQYVTGDTPGTDWCVENFTPNPALTPKPDTAGTDPLATASADSAPTGVVYHITATDTTPKPGLC